MDHLLILTTLIPIFFSLLIVIIGSNRFGQIFIIVSNLITLALCWPLYQALTIKGDITYLLGNFENKFGIELKLNYLSFIMLLLINIISLACNIYKFSFQNFKYSKNSLLLLMIAGFTGIILANDIFNIYVFIELSSIAAYALLADSKHKSALKSAFDYLVFGTIFATFYLVGVAFIYLLTGTLNITELIKTTYYYNGYSAGFLKISFFFMILGALGKLAVFPLHSYLIKVYQKSDDYLTAFFAGISTKVNLYLLVIIIFNIFSYPILKQYFHINLVLMIIGVVAAIYSGAIASMGNKTNKTILTFSSFSQIGYILIAFGLGTYAGISSGLTLMINHALSKTGLFLLTSENIAHLKVSNFWLRNFKKFFYFIFLANLLGLPPLPGFFAKFMLFSELIKQEQWLILIGLMISISLSISYGIKLLNNHNIVNNEIEKNEEVIYENINYFNLLISLSILTLPILLMIYYYYDYENFLYLAAQNFLFKR